MKIGALSKATETPVGTIRYYERQGLLGAAGRTDANYRVYDATHAERLNFIRHCRTLDMALEEIRALLRFRDAPDTDCGGVNQLLDDHIGHVAQRIRELRSLEKDLRQLRRACKTPRDAAHCGILDGLEQDAAAQRGASSPARSAHLAGVHGGVGAPRPGKVRAAR